MQPELGMCTQAAFGNRNLLQPGRLGELVAAGIEWVEIGGPNTTCFDYEDDAYVGSLVEAVGECGLRVWSMHGPFCPIAMDDPDARERGIALLIRAGRIAERLGAGRMVAHPGRDVPTVDRAREIGWARDAVSRVLDAIPESVTIAVESTSHPYLGVRPDDLLGILDGLDPARAGICLDTGHWNMAGHLMTSAPRVVRRIATVHLHDSEGERDDHRMPGDGTIDWPRLIGILREGGYGGPLMLEAGPRARSLGDHWQEYSLRMAAFIAAADIR